MSTKRTSPEETATRLLLQDARERQPAVRERRDYSWRNFEADMQDVIRQAQERLAECEEARQYVSEACKSLPLLLLELVLTQALHRAEFFN